MHPVTSITTAIATTTTTTLFNFHDHTIRTQLDDKGDLWFVAVDICAALGVQNSSQALSRLDDDEKGLYKCYTLGGMQTLAAVNEPGLYALVFSSRKKEAQDFKRWVKRVILPTLRKDGAYFKDEEKLFTNEMSLEELDARMIEASAQHESMRQAKMTRLKAERIRELAEDRLCQRKASGRSSLEWARDDAGLYKPA